MRKIKRELEHTRRTLNDAIHSGVHAAREESERREIFKDPYGAASLTHDDEVAAAVVEHRARALEAIERALEDLDAGRYGVCRDCEEAIPPARLRVMPFATRCVRCQARFERERRAA